MNGSALTESQHDAADAIYTTIVPAGEPWLHPLNAGQTLRILDLEGNQAADTLFYSAHDPSERYSAVDTIRAQGNLYLTTGSRLLSNDGTAVLNFDGAALTQVDG